MKLSTSQQNIITPVVANAYGNSRDELGKLALVWASAEHGHAMPTRMVISAHHAGSNEFWGHGNGIITFEQIKSLASAFPRAASAIGSLKSSASTSTV